MIKKRYFLQLSLVTLGIMISCVYLYALITPSKEAARVRNSIVHQPGQITDFTWGPSSFPADFKIETLAPPLDFQQFINSLPIDPSMSETDKFILAAQKILERDRSGGPIQSNTVDAFYKIKNEGIGWCSDYTQVFNGIAHALNIPVREWGMSFDRYNGDGHAFNEIYDQQLNKWVFIDTFNAFYATNQAGEPLSVLELRQLLDTSPNDLIIQKIDQTQFGFASNEIAVSYYQRGMPMLFLIWANDVFSYDSNPFIQFAGTFSRMAEQATGILLGINQEIRLYPDPGSIQQQKELLSLKYTVLSIIALNVILGMLFILILFRMFNHRINHG